MTSQDNPTQGPDIEALFQLGSGRFDRLLERARLAHGARLHLGRVAALSAAVAWVPLLILAAIEGVAWGNRVAVPLLKDFLPYGQFLLATPVLVFGEKVVGKRLGWTVAELRRSDILAPEDTPALDIFLTRVIQLWQGSSVNVVLLLLTCAVTIRSLWGVPEWLTGGWQSVGGRLTLPGWWYLLISLSLLRFLVLRWLWRFLLWSWLLWRAARLRLQLQPVHPDRAGGLAFLGGVQVGFSLLVFAFSVQLSCLIADAAWYRGADPMAFKGHVLVFVVISVLLLILPLIVFAPALVYAREEGLVFLSGSGNRSAVKLERKLRSNRTRELPESEISSLADFGELYENARLMRPLPLELRHILSMVLAAILPFLPLVFLVMPAQEVLRTLVELIK